MKVVLVRRRREPDESPYVAGCRVVGDTLHLAVTHDAPADWVQGLIIALVNSHRATHARCTSR